jgi:hypothetical protein
MFSAESQFATGDYSGAGDFASRKAGVVVALNLNLILNPWRRAVGIKIKSKIKIKKKRSRRG